MLDVSKGKAEVERAVGMRMSACRGVDPLLMRGSVTLHHPDITDHFLKIRLAHFSRPLSFS